MPREIARKPRFIYPTIATSLSIAEVSALAELLFWRILPQADDQGRLTGQPKQLKAIACPMRDEITVENIPQLLKELEDAALIIKYSTSSEPLIQIKSWWSFQSGMRRIYPSKYPAPDGWEDRVKAVSDGQTPTNAPKVPPISGYQVIRVSGNQGISKSPLLRKGAPTKQADPIVNEIFTEMRTYLGFPDRVQKDPIPNYGKEGQAIKRMLTRGFTREEILASWRSKVSQRGGEFVSMTWVNEDIGKKGGKAGEQPKPKQKRAKGPLQYIRGAEEPGPEGSEDMPGMR